MLLSSKFGPGPKSQALHTLRCLMSVRHFSNWLECTGHRPNCPGTRLWVSLSTSSDFYQTLQLNKFPPPTTHKYHTHAMIGRLFFSPSYSLSSILFLQSILKLWWKGIEDVERLPHFSGIVCEWISYCFYQLSFLATHSSVPAWKTPWTEESGSLQSMTSQRVEHDWVTKYTHTHTHTHTSFLYFLSHDTSVKEMCISNALIYFLKKFSASSFTLLPNDSLNTSPCCKGSLHYWRNRGKIFFPQLIECEASEMFLECSSNSSVSFL